MLIITLHCAVLRYACDLEGDRRKSVRPL